MAIAGTGSVAVEMTGVKAVESPSPLRAWTWNQNVVALGKFTQTKRLPRQFGVAVEMAAPVTNASTLE